MRSPRRQRMRASIAAGGNNVRTSVIPLLVHSGTTTSTNYARPARNTQILWTAGNWSGTVSCTLGYSFKTNNATYAAYICLYDITAGAVVVGSEMSTTNTVYYAVTSDPVTLVDGHEYEIRMKVANAAATAASKHVVLFVKQTGNITKCEQHFILQGGTPSTVSTNYEAATRAAVYKYDSDNWNGTVNIYLEATLDNSGSYTSYTRLVTTGGSAVTNGELSNTGTTHARVRSSALTLVDETEYTLEYKTSNASGTAYLQTARLIFVQSGTPTKCEAYYCLSGAYDDTTSTNLVALNCKNEWISGNFNITATRYFETTSYISNTAGTVSVALVGDSTLATLTRTGAGSTTKGRVRSTAVTMNSNADWDTQFKTSSGSYTAYVNASHLVKICSWTNTVADPPSNPAVTAAEPSPLSGIAPLTVQFNCTVSYGTAPYSYSWQVYDPNTEIWTQFATTEDPSYQFTTTGRKECRVIVTDSNNLQALAVCPASIDVLAPSSGTYPWHQWPLRSATEDAAFASSGFNLNNIGGEYKQFTNGGEWTTGGLTVVHDSGQYLYSTDDGFTWRRGRNEGLRCWFGKSIIAHPQNSTRFYGLFQNQVDDPGFGSDGLYLTTNSGDTWERVVEAYPWRGYENYEERASCHLIAYDPNTTTNGSSGTWYVAMPLGAITPGRIVSDGDPKTTDIPGTNTSWVNKANGNLWVPNDAKTQWVFKKSVTTGKPLNSYLWKSTSNGAINTWTKGQDLSGYGDITYLRCGPGGFLFLGTSKGIYRSTDGGSTFSPFHSNLPTNKKMIRSMHFGDSLYRMWVVVDDDSLAANASPSNAELWKSTHKSNGTPNSTSVDVGSYWVKVPTTGTDITVAVPNPLNDDRIVLFMGTKVQYTTNGTVASPTWTTVTTQTKGILYTTGNTFSHNKSYQEDVWWHPSNEMIAVAMSKAVMWRTTNGGQTWTQNTRLFTGANPARSGSFLGFDYTNKNYILYGTSDVTSVFSSNRGRSWTMWTATPPAGVDATPYHLGSAVCCGPDGQTRWVANQKGELYRWYNNSWLKVISEGAGIGQYVGYDLKTPNVNKVFYRYYVLIVSGGTVTLKKHNNLETNVAKIIGQSSNGYVYAMSTTQIYQYDEASDSFVLFATAPSGKTFYTDPHGFRFAAKDNNVIYTAYNDTKKTLVKFDKQTGNWTSIGATEKYMTLTGLTGVPPVVISVDHSNSSVIAVSFEEPGVVQILRTSDGGSNWTDVTDNIPRIGRLKIGIHPITGDLFAGKDLGFWVRKASYAQADSYVDDISAINYGDL